MQGEVYYRLARQVNAPFRRLGMAASLSFAVLKVSLGEVRVLLLVSGFAKEVMLVDGSAELCAGSSWSAFEVVLTLGV